ncbi:Crp/Fnr family transcriptional regulator [Devosia limi DSM 17137]|uniref:Crp/Fnr family transcriptional regulator n=1 Tax=Devosia limi DSM 17137 TaxID=1121477 RepID=A0A0F5LRK4_9HYPH|nr:Crp/Fnr family transcriptional regulator [Devosia limi]KKB84228.1 Crp/Fnr family transcriptional regulator [Devosia limi DSM 17137]KKB84287.1 Crp/Fnr family transcriptional regulator [Devosia limi DSM 17137]SHE83074.1 cAMP-binding domain of CRP or a regulatory subunit of cAMP-dependent protein kinases [Devosia limi DSM 17137]
MSVVLPSSARRVPCEQCPLRTMAQFRAFEPAELKFVSSFKTGELQAETGATLLSEGAHSAHLYTVLSGWAFRYKLLPDGRRQILNYMLPGDLVGLQGSVIGEMQHSVEALSPLVLCVFQRDRLDTLFRNHPGLGFDITWLAAREERMLDDHLLSLGRRTAIERAAYLLAFLHQRAASVGLSATSRLHIPISQLHVADTLGLSIVHTNKTLRKLAERQYIRWLDRACEVLDVEGLMAVAGWEGLPDIKRPLI